MSRARYWWYRLRRRPLSCRVDFYLVSEWHNGHSTFSDPHRPFWVVVGDGKTRNLGY